MKYLFIGRREGREGRVHARKREVEKGACKEEGRREGMWKGGRKGRKREVTAA